MMYFFKICSILYFIKLSSGQGLAFCVCDVVAMLFVDCVVSIAIHSPQNQVLLLQFHSVFKQVPLCN